MRVFNFTYFCFNVDFVLYDSTNSDNILLEKLSKAFNVPIYALDNFDYSSEFINVYINLFDQKPNAMKPDTVTKIVGIFAAWPFFVAIWLSVIIFVGIRGYSWLFLSDLRARFKYEI